jgi:curved DNA-binding protein CbpA
MASSKNRHNKNKKDKNENKKEAEEKFKLINEAYAVLSDATKRKEYDDFRRHGYREGRQFEFTNFRRNFDPFEEFRRFFEGNSFGFDNDDDKDIFSHNNIFRRFKGFGGGFDDFDSMGGFGDFEGNSGFSFSSSTAGGMGSMGSATSKSVKKTTQVM